MQNYYIPSGYYVQITNVLISGMLCPSGQLMPIKI